MWWMLAREVLRLRGSIGRDTQWDVMPDLFFYRDPEEEEEERSVKSRLQTADILKYISYRALAAETQMMGFFPAKEDGSAEGELVSVDGNFCKFVKYFQSKLKWRTFPSLPLPRLQLQLQLR